MLASRGTRAGTRAATTTPSTCRAGAARLASLRPADRSEGPRMPLELVVYPDSGGKYRWRLESSNGQTIDCSGESVASKPNAREAAENVKLRGHARDRRRGTAVPSISTRAAVSPAIRALRSAVIACRDGGTLGPCPVSLAAISASFSCTASGLRRPVERCTTRRRRSSHLHSRQRTPAEDRSSSSR